MKNEHIDDDILSEYRKISSLTNDKLFNNFKSKEDGLSNNEANYRLKVYGKNVIKDEKIKKWYDFLFDSCKILLFIF